MVSFACLRSTRFVFPRNPNACKCAVFCVTIAFFDHKTYFLRITEPTWILQHHSLTRVKVSRYFRGHILTREIVNLCTRMSTCNIEKSSGWLRPVTNNLQTKNAQMHRKSGIVVKYQLVILGFVCQCPGFLLVSDYTLDRRLCTLNYKFRWLAHWHWCWFFHYFYLYRNAF